MNLYLFGFALFSYYVFHSFLAHKKIKSILMDQWIPQKLYRIIYNISALGLLIPIYIFYKKTTPNYFFENTLLQNLGLIELGLGMVLLIIVLFNYNLSEFSGLQQYKYKNPPTPQKLITKGFNKWVRHPLYFSMLLIIWGFFLFRPSDINFVLAGVTSIYLYFGTKLEEGKLVEEFGNEYKLYQKSVPMLIPFTKF